MRRLGVLYDNVVSIICNNYFMWLILAFCSAALLGFYDVFKKLALSGNAVLPVLFLNTMICSLLFLPFILLSSCTNMLDGSTFYVEQCGWEQHKYILLKACIVLSSWVFGYFAMKNLPSPLSVLSMPHVR